MSSKFTVITPATSTHTATLIFLHGLGDTGHGWAGTLGEIKPSHVKLICPTAPTIPVTLNGGLRMPSWFDLKSLDPKIPEDEEGILKAAQTIQGLIQQEIAAGIPANRIVIGGFSQGGALSLHIGLTGTTKLGGIVALSSWLPLNQKVNVKKVNDIPVLQCHGDSDPLVQYAFGHLSAQLLKGHLANYEFKTYPGLGHSSNTEELEDVKRFLISALP